MIINRLERKDKYISDDMYRVKQMNELKQILEEIRPDLNFEAETKLIDDGILDSFDIISIVGELNMHYGIEINVEDLLPENFNSMEAIFELVTKLQED